MKRLLLIFVLMHLVCGASAQRVTDKENRGLVAVPSRTSGNFVSWKVLGEEYYDVTYNLYANGSKIASDLKKSNYNDNNGKASTLYQVAAVVKGVEQEKCKAVTSWSAGYKQINLIEPVDRNGDPAGSYYQVNDVSLGDLTGDGITEFIIKLEACCRPGVISVIVKAWCIEKLISEFISNVDIIYLVTVSDFDIESES